MARPNLSKCGRFVVLDTLHIDRNVFDSLARSAQPHDLRVQDAIQLAICAFNERNSETTGPAARPRAAQPPSTQRLDADAAERRGGVD